MVEVHAAETNYYRATAELLPALQRLDALLEHAVGAVETAYGPETAGDAFRGLYVSRSDVENLLRQTPGSPLLYRPSSNGASPAADASRLQQLIQRYALTPFDVDVLLLTLAPELDRRYERLYAYLQDHVGRRRPTVDLALHLFCPDAAARLSRRAHFDPGAPLIRHDLVHLLSEAEQPRPSLLAHTLHLDEQIVRFLLYEDRLDARLFSCCELLDGLMPQWLHESQVLRQVEALVGAAQRRERPLRLYFQGSAGIGRRYTAVALAATLDRPLLYLNADLIPADEVDQTVCLACRYAVLYDTLLYVDAADTLHVAQPARRAHLLQQVVAAGPRFLILAGVSPWQPVGNAPLAVAPLTFTRPDFAQRRACWQAHLATADIPVTDRELAQLSGRFRLTPAQIATAAATVAVTWQASASDEGGGNTPPALDALFAAARAQSGHDLAALTRRIRPLYTWDDIVLPPASISQLHEICQRVTSRHQVLDAWGFGRRLSLGHGTNALFTGPSGAGKTMAAEVIANALGLDLYQIDLSGVVSKYIGETEKNLDRIFAAAENANAILFFDEADALFGKRSEVRDSHDRYANIEISYLLQKMESYDGLAILATNLRQNLDDSFVRRLAFTVHFPFPTAADRLRIWQGIWPAATPLAADVDLAWLAQRFKLSGGNIKNVALAAAYLAANDASSVTLDHILQAIRREYQKLGKALSTEELYGREEVPAL